ncbi:ribonuclease R [Flocculibacter collagenilyticus]|uniref:ribonuclease R n=1 Tax=Flocculibacter collagenilyticus TaxID=2744479 RepID=UPI0018F3D832|nr:ribonuclease R [Flocculibacter collagenilyticus]
MPNQDPYHNREKEKYDNPVPSREFIISLLEQHDKPLGFDDIAVVLKVFDDERLFALKKRLRAMERDGQVVYAKNNRYGLPDKMDLVKGRVIGHRDGFGFLNVEGESKDWFLPAHQMEQVIHGDYVLAKAGKRQGNKTEARIVRILEQRDEVIVGRLVVEHGVAYVRPEDSRITHDIIIRPGGEKEAAHGQVVSVEITQRPTRRMHPVGKIVDVIGQHMAPGLEIEVALRNHDIPHEWPEAVDKQVNALDDEVPESAKQARIDLRHLPLVTIDGEDARDFDDAVYCEPKTSGGWRLWVAIADVSSYVTYQSALDKEAISRGTSVYFPEKVIPMLPEKLSNGLCSLNPLVDRLCMVCEMTVSANGKLSGYKFYEATMQSKARFTYTKVGAILEGDEALRQEYADFVPHLTHLHEMYQALKSTRTERGAIEFETVETRFVFNEQRKIARIEPVHRNDAHKLIEECMILANVSAARFLEKHEAYGLFRVHDKPDEEKLSNFRGFLGELGIETRLSLTPEPKELTEELQRVSERDEIDLIQVMLLRSMKQAVYQSDNIGHFGLALPAYAHFTSPIRRYPDLVVHRAIKGILKHQGQQTTGAHAYSEEEVLQLGESCSMAERRADDATREVSDWLKCEFMQDHIGDEFDGVVASVTNFGLFVRINDLMIDGLVHVTSLKNDYYHFDGAKQMLIGEASRVVYKLGDKVSIRVASVNLDDRKIDFVLTGDSAPQRTKSKIRSRKSLSDDESKSTSNKDKKRKGRRKGKGSGQARTSANEQTSKSTKKKSPRKKSSVKTGVKKSSAGKAKKRPGKNARKRTAD